MKLVDLNLRKNLYRARPTDVIKDTSDTFSSSNTSSQGVGSSNNTTINNLPALAVAPGTIITSCTWQTSNSSNRIELTPDDNLYAYNGNNIQVQINSDGIRYDGALQPVDYWGEIDGITNAWVIQPAGFTAVKNGVGNYTITHSLGTAIYIVLLTPTSGHFRGQVLNKTTTTFDVTFQQSVYAAGLYTGEALVDVIFQFEMVKRPQ